MRLSTLFAPLLAAVSVSGQSTSSYVDPKTNITFQRYSDMSGWSFGIALPTTPTTDFIGQFVSKGTGWSGISLGGSMLNHLLLATWPNAQSNLYSFRKTAMHGSPATAAGTWGVKVIKSGTFVNTTHYGFTFVCYKCITNDANTFSPTAPTTQFGFAYSTAAPTTKASNTTQFMKHTSDGTFTANLTAARSDNYTAWAALAT